LRRGLGPWKCVLSTKWVALSSHLGTGDHLTQNRPKHTNDHPVNAPPFANHFDVCRAHCVEALPTRTRHSLAALQIVAGGNRLARNRTTVRTHGARLHLFQSAEARPLRRLWFLNFAGVRREWADKTTAAASKVVLIGAGTPEKSLNGPAKQPPDRRTRCYLGRESWLALYAIK